jgi:hypothetical protein
MALHCRAELWLAGHGLEGEQPTKSAQRTFDTGHFGEAALFDPPFKLPGGQEVGGWWLKAEEIIDPVTNRKIITADWEISHRQHEVEFAGYKGHIDALLAHRHERTWILPDAKSSSSLGFDKASFGSLSASEFSREYLGQLHAYRAGLVSQGFEIATMLLLYWNKEQSKLVFREVEFSQAIEDEALERLSYAKSDIFPQPDYAWKEKEDIPLRCGYCPQKFNCATKRNQPIEMYFDKKARPKWKVLPAVPPKLDG